MIYPIGIQNFESLINDGYMYVDSVSLSNDYYRTLLFS